MLTKRAMFDIIDKFTYQVIIDRKIYFDITSFKDI